MGSSLPPTLSVSSEPEPEPTHCEAEDNPAGTVHHHNSEQEENERGELPSESSELPFPVPSAALGESSLHPVVVLDELLLQLRDEEDRMKKRREILRAVDFLLPKSTVDGALSILDDHRTMLRRVVHKKGTGLRQRTSARWPHKCVYTVRGSSKRTKHSVSFRTYYCQTHPRFCSCRSFVDRARRNPRNICKHLLAIQLAEHLTGDDGDEIVEEVRGTKQSWAETVLGRIFQTKTGTGAGTGAEGRGI